MIKGPEKFQLPTIGKEKVEVLINWTNSVSDCRYVKLRFGDEESLIPKSALIKLALYLGNEEEQDNLIPVKSVRIHQFRKEFTIKVLEDVLKGQTIKFTGSFDVPLNADSLPVLSSTDTVG